MAHHASPRHLTEQQIVALGRLQHCPTRYEAVLTTPEGQRLLVGYTPRKSKAGLLRAAQRVGPQIVAAMPGLTDEHRMTWAAGGFDLGNGARIAFSGRTQRDAIMAGTELPFLGG